MRKIKEKLIVLLVFMTIIWPGLTQADTKKVGEIVKAKGRVSIVRANTFKGIFWKKDPRLFIRDIVRTKRKSMAWIDFIDGSKVVLEERSRLIIEKYIPGGEVRVKNPSGKVVYKVSKRVRGKFMVETPTALIGVKGTEFATITTPIMAVVMVKTGMVEVVNPEYPEIKVVLPPKSVTVVRIGAPPAPPTKVSEKIIEKIFKPKEVFKKEEKVKGEGKKEENKKIESKRIVSKKAETGKKVEIKKTKPTGEKEQGLTRKKEVAKPEETSLPKKEGISQPKEETSGERESTQKQPPTESSPYVKTPQVQSLEVIVSQPALEVKEILGSQSETIVSQPVETLHVTSEEETLEVATTSTENEESVSQEVVQEETPQTTSEEEITQETQEEVNQQIGETTQEVVEEGYIHANIKGETASISVQLKPVEFGD